MSSALLDSAVAVSSLVLSVSGLVSNLLVVFLFYRKPSLRSPSNRFVGSLVAANLVGAGGLAAVEALGPRELAAALSALVATSSAFSTLAIALDRHSAVLSPLTYTASLTSTRSKAVIGASWLGAGLLASPHLVVRRPSRAFSLAHSLALLLAGLALPLLALILVYARMYAAARRNSVRTRRASICGEVGSEGRRASNSVFSAVLLREEGRAVRTGLLVVTSYLFCWTPYFASNTALACGATPLPKPLVLLAALSAATLNPCLYVFRNQTVRKETRRLVCGWEREGVVGVESGGTSSIPPPLRHASSSQCDSASVQSFQVGPLECNHTDTPTPPIADFVATYHQVGGDTNRYESVTFRLAARRCQSCVRQNSDSSTGSSRPLLSPAPRRLPASEPSTPRHFNTNHSTEPCVFKFQMGEESGELTGERPKRLERHSAVDDPPTCL